MQNKDKNPMLTGVIWKQVLRFFFPILIGVFFQQLYNTVDAVVVGRFAGKAALASVGGSSGQILNFLFSFFMGLSTGATVIIAHAFGADHPERVDDALHTTYAFGLVGGSIFGAVGFLFTKPLLRLLQTPADLMPSSILYVRILMAISSSTPTGAHLTSMKQPAFTRFTSIMTSQLHLYTSQVSRFLSLVETSRRISS